MLSLFSRKLACTILLIGLFGHTSPRLAWSQEKPLQPSTSRTVPTDPKASPQPSVIGDPLAFLPAESRIVVSLANIRQMLQSFRSTGLFGLLQDPEMQPLVKHLTRYILGESLGYRSYRQPKESIWKRAGRVFSTLTQFSWGEAVRIFQGPHAFAVVGIPSGSTPLNVGVVSKVSDMAKAQTLINNVLQLLPLNRTTYSYALVQVSAIRGLENEIHIAFVGNFCLFATTQSLMQQMLDRTKGKGPSVLQNPAYQQFLQQAAVSSSGSVFVAVDQLLRDLAANMGGRQGFFLQLLGLDVWQSLGLTLGIHQQNFVTRLFLQFQKKGNLRGLNRLLALPAAQESLLQHTPEQPMVTGLVRVPFVAIWDDVLTTFQKIEPRFYQRFRLQLEQFERGILQLSVRQLLTAFGESSSGFLFSYPGGGMFPQYAHVFGLQDAKQIEQTLTQLFHLLSIKIIQQDYRGVSWKMLQASQGTYRMMRMMPYSYRSLAQMLLQSSRHICFSFVQGRLYVTLSSHTMKTLIDAQLAPSQELQTLRKSMQQQAQGRGAWLNIDSKSTVTLLYNTFLAAAPFAGRMLYRTFRPLYGFSTHDLPRSQVLTRYMKTGTFSIQSTEVQSLWQIQSGLGVEWLVIGQMLAGAVQGLFLQFKIPSYVRNVRDFTRLKQQSPAWEDQGNFALAHTHWSRLAQYAVFQAVALAAKKQAEHFGQLQENRLRQMLANLRQSHQKQIGDWGTWLLGGDWAMHKDVLRVITNKQRGATLRAGASDLSSYTLSFEVRNPTHGFSMRFHLNPQETLSLPYRWHVAPKVRTYGAKTYRYAPTYRRYRRYGSKYPAQPSYVQQLHFPKKHFQKDQWVPVKVKVRGNLISYWFGLKHYTHRTAGQMGAFAILVPAEGQFELRGLALQVHQSREDAQAAKPYPSVQVQLVGHPQTVELNETAEFRLLLKNVGRLPADKLKIQVRLSPHLAYVSAFSAPSSTVPVWKESPRLVEFTVPRALEARESLRLHVRVKAVKSGSALAQAFLQFAQMTGEISLETRLHIAGETASPDALKK